MPMDESDFPIYQLLIQSGERGIEELVSAFEDAMTGTDEQKFRAARVLFGIAFEVSLEENDIPGLTKDMTEKSLRSCVAVFDDIGSRNHSGGLLLAAWSRVHGVGCEKDTVMARALLEKAEKFGARGHEVADLHEELKTASHVKPDVPPRPRGPSP